MKREGEKTGIPKELSQVLDEKPGFCQNNDSYRFRLISSPNNSSTVVIIFELAWKPR